MTALTDRLLKFALAPVANSLGDAVETALQEFLVS
jgi:hypothetical protein